MEGWILYDLTFFRVKDGDAPPPRHNNLRTKHLRYSKRLTTKSSVGGIGMSSAVWRCLSHTTQKEDFQKDPKVIVVFAELYIQDEACFGVFEYSCTCVR